MAGWEPGPDRASELTGKEGAKIDTRSGRMDGWEKQTRKQWVSTAEQAESEGMSRKRIIITGGGGEECGVGGYEDGCGYECMQVDGAVG